MRAPKSENIGKVYEHLLRHGKSTITRISSATGLSRATTSRAIEYLTKAKTIRICAWERVRDGQGQYVAQYGLKDFSGQRDEPKPWLPPNTEKCRLYRIRHRNTINQRRREQRAIANLERAKKCKNPNS